MQRFSALLLITLAGCAMSPDERAQDVVNTYGPSCASRGYTAGTDPWRQCIQAEQQVALAFRQQEAEVMHRRGIYCLDGINSRSRRC